MPKPSQGSRFAAGKKKTKKRPEARPIAETASTPVPAEPVHVEENGNGHTETPVLQFRPKAREAAPARSSGGRAAASRTTLQPVDYSYVYTDLRIIGVLMTSLLVLLVALTFVIR
jgi:hypothetical protein